ncbi:hypothetical protein BJP25_21810 [Actinokineospora bangkokensis]|uniref:DUF7711 domain-containing protein n=1 Tax=Actinokineospora bangkokensis TaxID=1193682 RepID=A0A1Q9LKW7_9PSEU|nr:hypothetical protein BJP25_21810 [Actinokineospora bangkokensis]
MQHVADLAGACADMDTRPAAIFPLRVVGLWVAGELLGPPRDVETALVALEVDVPEVPWLTEPKGAAHWGQAVRLPQLPLTVRWRSAHAPVWNHVLDRPVPVWTRAGGVDEGALAALRDGEGERVRPAERGDVAQRVAEELGISHRALSASTDEYRERRYKPGKLEPVADALWRAAEGYLDLVSAQAERSWSDQV